MRQPLNFGWSFINDYKEEYLEKLPDNKEVIDIPHSAIKVPYNYFNELDYQRLFTYEKIFDLEEQLDNRIHILHFAGLMVKAHIYLNGNDLGIHYSGYVPIDLDVTSVIKQKNNRLVVIVDGSEDENCPPFGYAVDYLTFAGIYREVEIISHLNTYIKNIYAHSDLEGNLDISYDKVGDEDIRIKHCLFFEGEQISDYNEDKGKIIDPVLWDLDNPKLYTLRTIVELNNEKEEYITRFGIREAIFKPDGFYLNGKKTKLVGLNRHQGYPIVGYAMPESMQKEDADLLKDIGLNIVRTSHYPQSEHFLNRCDEIGLLVVNEVPGWQFVSKKPEWRDNFMVFLEKMILLERNHPSLIANGVRIDESIDDHELYSKANEKAHQLDPIRQTLGVRNFKNSELLEDIYAYNDFICSNLSVGLDNPKHIKHQGKPYLVTEYLGHMDPYKATTDLDRRIEVARRHMKVLDDNYKYNKISGAIGWCFVDYHTHIDFGSGDHICAHGVLDMYRNPKFSSYVYQSQREDKPILEVLSNIKPGDIAEAVYGDIYVATNCDYVSLYKNDEYVGDFYPNKKEYKYVKHPLILIDDLVGKTFKEERFLEKHWARMGKTFSYYAIHGFNKMKFKDAFFLGRMMLKYKISYSDLVYYWNKHVASWGGIAKKWTFKGFKDGKEVVSKEIGPSKVFDLKVETNRTQLEMRNTYDVVRVKVSHVDEYDSLMYYSQRVINIKTSGAIEAIGNENQTLLGGQLSIYVRSKEKGQGKLTLKMDNIEKEIEFEVI